MTPVRLAGWAALSAVALAATGAGLAAFGSWQWGVATHDLLGRLDAARVAPAVARRDEAQIGALPAPVQRYLRAVLTDGQPMILVAEVTHAGRFNMSEATERWRPFTSRQRVTTSPPGFVWDGRIAMAPGLPARVHDAYVAGEGLLRPSILGLHDLAGQRGTGAIALGELMRYLAETPWYPTALLPGQGVTWRAVDDRSAEATLMDGPLAVTMLVRFGEDGLIAAMHARERARIVGGATTMVPWDCRMSDYRCAHGMLVPFAGEVAWRLPDRDAPYYRATIRSLAYEFAA